MKCFTRSTVAAETLALTDGLILLFLLLVWSGNNIFSKSTQVFTGNCFLNDTINTAKSVLSGHPRKEILPLHEMHENIDLSIHWKEKHLQLGGILTRKGHPISTNRNIAEVEMNKITTKLQFCLHKFYLFVDIQQLELKKKSVRFNTKMLYNI